MSENQTSFLVRITHLLSTIAQHVTASGIILTAVWIFASPIVTPYLAIPDKLDGALTEIAQLNLDISSDRLEPFIDFKGLGQITYSNSDSITVLYMLQRKASCDSVVHIRFWNIDTGTYTYEKEISAVKSPTSSRLIPFKVSINLPPSLPKGRYVYVPYMTPLDCGEFGPVSVPPTNLFTIN